MGPRGKPTGRIHLTALVPDLGDVHTLCGQTFPAASATSVEEEADCQLCLRRRRNPSLVSAALFEAGLGAKLLELSLEKVGAREPRTPVRPAAAGAPPRPRVVPEPQPPPVPSRDEPAAAAASRASGELKPAGMKEVGEDLYRSPAGVLLRLRRRSEAWVVAELVFEGKTLLRRRSEGRLELRVGDVQVEIDAADGSVRAVYSLG